MADQQPRQPSFRPFFRMASIARIEPPPPQPTPPVARPLRLPSLLGQPATAALPQAQPQPTPPPPARPQIQAPPPAQPQPPTPPPPPARPQIQTTAPARPQPPTPPPPPVRPQIQAPAPAQPQPPTPPPPPARPQIQAPTQTQQQNPPSQPQPLREPTPPPPSPRPAAAARNLTPPQSPRVIKTASSTPTPPASPRTRLAPGLAPNPEPEPNAQAASQQKSVITNQSVANSSVKAVAKGNDDGYSSSSNGSSPHPKKEQRSTPTAAWDGNASSAPSTAWKKKASRSGDEREAEAGIRSITIAGENLGAYMELVGSHAHRRHGQKLQEVHQQQHALKTNPVWKQQGGESGGSGTEKSSNEAEEKAVRGEGTMRPMAAAVNSNVQGINNSLMMNSSCKHGSPGVHITLSSHRGKHKNSGGTTDHHHHPQ